jgi:antitoxin (DNA-binding transcriptional repressor) of toxin-antitoxin stability system
MTVVTLAEAQAQLADLLRRAATGEQIAIEHDGARLALSVARLPTPEEEAENQRRAEVAVHELMRDMARWSVEDGVTLAPNDPLRQFLPSEKPAA